jgi:hypothetical protein
MTTMTKVNIDSMLVTTIKGIPCYVTATYISPYIPAYTSGAPENCYPAEGGEVEWEAYDRKGYRAKWLEKLATPEDCRRIEADLFELSRD